MDSTLAVAQRHLALTVHAFRLAAQRHPEAAQRLRRVADCLARAQEEAQAAQDARHASAPAAPG